MIDPLNLVFAVRLSLEVSSNFLVAQTVKNLPAMQETLDQEDLLEKGLAIHFSVLACRIPWTEEPGGLQSMGVAKSWTPQPSNT